MVSPAAQSSQGGTISSFYQSKRILDLDAFYVDIY